MNTHQPLAQPFVPFIRALFVLIAVFCVFGFLIFALPASAQQTAFEQFGEASTLPTDSIAIIIARVIRAAISVVGIIFILLIIYAGFLYLLARGEVEPIKKANKIFQQSIIGLIIIFSAYSITTFILNRLLEAAFTGTSSAVADAYSEPLSGSLGGGILDDHYPKRDAVDIPRNTRIFVTFKEAIDPESIVANNNAETRSGYVSTDAVVIYPTAEGPGSALASNEVVVTYDEDFKIFVFDPVEYLGSAEKDTNYTVVLTTEIERYSGSAAFTGVYASGYAWTFEVSTEIDLTPPYVTSIVPQQGSEEPRNITIEISFSEAMDPVASTGSYLASEKSFFTNIEAFDTHLRNIEGTFAISNGYRTVGFTTTDACGEDPCGDTIYCLPSNQLISVIAKAATLKEEEVPQAKPTGITFDGVVDAAGNSLDGNNDGDACGSALDLVACKDGGADDNYEWSFTTSDDVNTTVPQIIVGGLDPWIGENQISASADVEAMFNTYLKTSTVKTHSVSLWPDPYYEFWFAIRARNNDEKQSTSVKIEHPALVSTDVGGWDYWPVFTSDIKSAYQICMYPAIGPGTNCKKGRDANKAYCCEGLASGDACQTQTQESAPYPIPEGIDDYNLPDNTETEL